MNEDGMRLGFSSTLLLFICSAFAANQNPAVVTPKHLELPSHYQQLARQARLQGTVVVQLTISSDGKVLDAESNSTDTELKAHPILQVQTAEIVRRWTFACVNCSAGSAHRYALTFTYKLEGNASRYDDTRIALDWPDHVSITANPPIVNP
jgi:TonB family protein